LNQQPSFLIHFLLLPTNPTPQKARKLSLPDLRSGIKQHTPSRLGFFKPATHKPPPPSNSTASNIAKNEERSALPPLEKRCPVYTFLDDSDGK
ncbi:hypothetical protein C7212DRAFT_337528, partial [Tuber magnatum]